MTISLPIFFALLLAASANENEPALCTYTDWAWHSADQRATVVEEFVKPYASLTDDERDAATGCSICAEDQMEISLPGVEPFFLCNKVAPDVTRALTRAMEAGFPVMEVVGYRVGKTKGDLDEEGLRTQYSHHAFGLAVDINPARNGLYDNCVEISSSCRLIRGGPWRPGAKGTVTPRTPVYLELQDMGWRWGGELHGSQKDFMHFSPSGD